MKFFSKNLRSLASNAKDWTKKKKNLLTVAGRDRNEKKEKEKKRNEKWKSWFCLQRAKLSWKHNFAIINLRYLVSRLRHFVFKQICKTYKCTKHFISLGKERLCRDLYLIARCCLLKTEGHPLNKDTRCFMLRSRSLSQSSSEWFEGI